MSGRLPAVREMSNRELAVELAARCDDWNAVRSDDEGHGGSPGEWLIERIDEIEAEIHRRATPTAMDAPTTENADG